MNLFTKSFFVFIIISILFIQCNTESNSGVTPSGYEYSKLFSGDGVSPNKGDFVYFEMDIMDDTGKILQSMRNLDPLPSVQIPEEGKEPAKANPLIDLLSISSVGDSLELYIPVDSMPGMGPQFADVNRFIYKVNIKDVENKDAYTEKLAAKQEQDRISGEAARAREGEIAELVKSTLASYKSGSLKGIQKLDSGLEYVIHEEGTGELTPVGNKITAHYYGVVKEDGSMFDNSFSKGRSFSFTLGRGEVIKGWDEGMAKIKTGGGKGTLFIPYDLAYGESGRPPRIPAKADLVFYVEIE